MINRQTIKFVCFALTFATVGCNKQPTADFTPDKPEYTAGETIHLSNKSSNADKYRWTLPDGQTSSSKDLDYPISDELLSGTFAFKLEAISKNGKKSDFKIQNISYTPGKGTLVVYPSHDYDKQTLPYLLSIDYGGFQTYSSPKTSEAPECNAAGYPTFVLTAGVHTVSMVYGPSVSTSETVTVKANRCNKCGIKVL